MFSFLIETMKYIGYMGILLAVDPPQLHGAEMNIAPKGVLDNRKILEEQLRKAALTGHLERLQELVDQLEAVDVPNDQGYTPLMLAASENHLGVVKFLLKKGASVAHKNKRGFTPLLLAAERDRLEVVKELLNHGAEIDEQNDQGLTALMLAASRNYLPIVTLLLNRGASTDLIDKKGREILSFGSPSLKTLISGEITKKEKERRYLQLKPTADKIAQNIIDSKQFDKEDDELFSATNFEDLMREPFDLAVVPISSNQYHFFSARGLAEYFNVSQLFINPNTRQPIGRIFIFTHAQQKNPLFPFDFKDAIDDREAFVNEYWKLPDAQISS